MYFVLQCRAKVLAHKLLKLYVSPILYQCSMKLDLHEQTLAGLLFYS